MHGVVAAALWAASGERQLVNAAARAAADNNEGNVRNLGFMNLGPECESLDREETGGFPPSF
jgi:hypothetical protein